ncbi:hypothetical protein GCM10007881_15810 [Mesorhizobium huakuii]|nr:hypothetical protein GCM10007881_15810 [Mesorhizobium huakuii]
MLQDDGVVVSKEQLPLGAIRIPGQIAERQGSAERTPRLVELKQRLLRQHLLRFELHPLCWRRLRRITILSDHTRSGQVPEPTLFPFARRDWFRRASNPAG